MNDVRKRYVYGENPIHERTLFHRQGKSPTWKAVHERTFLVGIAGILRGASQRKGHGRLERLPTGKAFIIMGLVESRSGMYLRYVHKCTLVSRTRKTSVRV